MRNALFAIALLSLGVIGMQAQTRTIRGTVLSAEDGLTVIGASVVVSGTNLGTITDMDGLFIISNVPEDATQIRVSYMDMITQTVAIQTGAIKIILSPAVESLDEVIVVAYGLSTKAAFTGSTSTIKSDKLEKRQVSNLSNALSGAVSGVQTLSSNGQPGTSATVRIRGIGSINAGTNPLYVLDGVPFDGDIASLNTQDIESVTVLKDAASAALYGSRGANGVILITTKKGRSGAPMVHFDGRVGINQRNVTNYDVIQDPKVYMEKVYEALYNGAYYVSNKSAEVANAYANQTIVGRSAGGLGYQVYTVPNGESMFGMDGKLNPHATAGWSDGKFFYKPDSWSKATFSNQMRQEYDLNISGGSDDHSYFVSGGYLDDRGLIIKSGFKRYTMRAKGDYTVYDWLKVGANLSFTYDDSDYPGKQDSNSTTSSANAFYMANMIAPIYPLYVRHADGSIMIDNRGNQVYDYGDGSVTGMHRTFMPIANPIGNLFYDREDYQSDVFSANWYATVDIIEGLKATGRFGVTLDNTRYTHLSNPYYGQASSAGGAVSSSRSRQNGLSQQLIVDYRKTFNIRHHMDLMFGYDGYSRRWGSTSAIGYNLFNPEVSEVNNTIERRMGYSSSDAYATVGIVARANYAFAEKYVGSVAFSRYASSRFHPDKRWGNFWSASGAWMLSSEGFMSDIDWIDYVKLKASFGQQGNDDVGNYYAYLDQYEMTGSDGVFADGTLVYKGNKNLTWEVSNVLNVGVDFELFQTGLSGSIDFFSRQTSNMLYYKPVAPSAGYSRVPMNIGSMRNSGVEIDLSYKFIHLKDFRCQIDANATFLNNKIIKLHPDMHGEFVDGTSVYTEGESRYRMYLVEYAGVNPDTGIAEYWTVGKPGTPDENKRIRTTNWSVANNHRIRTKDMLPTVYGGLVASFGYRNVDFSVQCAYQLGGTIYDSGYQTFMHGGMTSSAGINWHKDILQSWTETNSKTNVPRVNAQDSYTSATSTRWLTSSDYLSVNNIMLGYWLPRTWLNPIGISKVRIYAVADNVALFAARKGLDPRQSYISSTTALYTSIRTISGGVNITF